MLSSSSHEETPFSTKRTIHWSIRAVKAKSGFEKRIVLKLPLFLWVPVWIEGCLLERYERLRKRKVILIAGIFGCVQAARRTEPEDSNGEISRRFRTGTFRFQFYSNILFWQFPFFQWSCALLSAKTATKNWNQQRVTLFYLIYRYCNILKREREENFDNELIHLW